MSREINCKKFCMGLFWILMIAFYLSPNLDFSHRKLRRYINYDFVQDPRSIQQKMSQMQLQTSDSNQILKKINEGFVTKPEAIDSNSSTTETQSTFDTMDKNKN
mmetsp:Transcript_24048/g.36545  ORF Transcript_24048/g.36545 Transcript_24048/m.36545 type:complete len:104 (-) Transcript_24048:98-409(-)